MSLRSTELQASFRQNTLDLKFELLEKKEKMNIRYEASVQNSCNSIDIQNETASHKKVMNNQTFSITVSNASSCDWWFIWVTPSVKRNSAPNFEKLAPTNVTTMYQRGKHTM